MRPFEKLGVLLDDVLSIAVLLLLVAPIVGVGVVLMYLVDKAKEAFQ